NWPLLQRSMLRSLLLRLEKVASVEATAEVKSS
ncbi:hypothetical protein A2U01_0080892, partial [Trifolium medium]|nr:hypothetical protein [Trifolium medium]